MVTFILGLHIFGSFVFIGFALVVLYQIIAAKSNYPFVKKSAVAIGVHQAITGVLLGSLSPHMTILTACIRGLFLLAVLVVLVGALSKRLAYATR